MRTSDGQVLILSEDLWQLHEAIGRVTGLSPVRPAFLGYPKFDYVAAWGRKATSRFARALSRRTAAKYLALEDGFIRSVYPGHEHHPVSLVVDSLGVHYDVTTPSDLEEIITASATDFDAARLDRARRAMASLREAGVSKYNFAPRRTERELGLDPALRNGRVLVVDQTRGDCSISFGGATEETFSRMLTAAYLENPNSEIVVKVHPEVVLNRKRGHFSGLALNETRVKVISTDVNPWSLIDAVDTVYVVSSQLGAEALFAEKKVVCFGAPFYSGWGLTEDRLKHERRAARPTLEQLFAAVYFDYARYICPVSRAAISFEAAVDHIIAERTRQVGLDSNGWPQ